MSHNRLQRIFIRAKNSDGKWDSLSLEEVDDEQFNQWYGSYIQSRLGLDTRDHAVQYLDFLRISPVELNEKAMEELDES